MLLAIVSVATVLLLTACGGASESKGTKDQPATSGATEANGTTGAPSGAVTEIKQTSGFLGLIGSIPDSVHNRAWVQVNDYRRFREAFDIQLPGSEADEDALMEYLLRPIDMPQFFGSFISGYGQFASQALERRRYLGFDLRDVHRGGEVGFPPQVLEVLQGDFDPGVTAQALAACAECEPHEESERAGIKFYSWGEDLRLEIEKIFAPPAYDNLGRGSHIAVQTNQVFRSLELAGMRSLIDTSLGRQDSLAEVEQFRLLAAGLDELNAYGGLFTDQTQSMDQILADIGTFTQEAQAALKSRLEMEPLLLPYDAFATGAGRDSQGQYMAVVLVHPSERSARRNVELLRRRIEEAQSMWTNEPWSKFFDEMEIRSEGAVLLGKLRGERTRSLWIQFIFQRDPLLLHE
ncbi:MAG: hypothetical protein BZY88_04040 [SAR202 cluster bacterium Io17-Chloro-G9]|nr:MAG: hypothetical protein BZY88_04040 [SAR202 cluster bacterium Io17-Chloro-G9]